MATVTKGKTFGSTETVTATKLHELVDNATVTAIVNADVAAAANISSTKLDLSAAGYVTSGANTDFTGSNVTSGSMTVSGSQIVTGTLKVGTTNQGDLLYDNGTSIVRFTPGTAGQILHSSGTSVDPYWGFPHIKGWAKFTGTGTSVLINSYNVSGLTDNGTGDYTISWATDFADDTYAAFGNATSGHFVSFVSAGYLAGSTQIHVVSHVGILADTPEITLVAIGTQ